MIIFHAVWNTAFKQKSEFMKFALMYCIDLAYLVGISNFLDGKLF